MKRVLVASAAAIVVAVATALAGYAVSDTAHAEADAPLGPGHVVVELGIRHSKFSFDTLRVRPGTLVEFRVRNDDPIAHEFVLGDRSVHARHERGNESAHPPVPGEVSVPALDVGSTFYRFEKAGRYEFACHLPGHVAFGMRGWVIAEERMRR
jgi:uncharacterized cupredoxin-like copper-binding protein